MAVATAHRRAMRTTCKTCGDPLGKLNHGYECNRCNAARVRAYRQANGLRYVLGQAQLKLDRITEEVGMRQAQAEDENEPYARAELEACVCSLRQAQTELRGAVCSLPSRRP